MASSLSYLQWKRCGLIEGIIQRGGIAIYSVLQSSSSVKVLTEKNLSWHCIYFTTVGFITEISLDHLDHIHQRYSGLTIDYGEYFELTVDFYFD